MTQPEQPEHPPYMITAGKHIDKEMVENCEDALSEAYGKYHWGPRLCWILNIQADEKAHEWIVTIAAPDGVSSKPRLAFVDKSPEPIRVWFEQAYMSWGQRLNS